MNRLRSVSLKEVIDHLVLEVARSDASSLQAQLRLREALRQETGEWQLPFLGISQCEFSLPLAEVKHGWIERAWRWLTKLVGAPVPDEEVSYRFVPTHSAELIVRVTLARREDRFEISGTEEAIGRAANSSNAGKQSLLTGIYPDSAPSNNH